MRLVIGDAVRIDVDGREETFGVVKMSAGTGQIYMAPLHEANVDARNRDKASGFVYTSKYAGSFQKARARQVSVSPIGELRDPGFRE